MIEITEVNIKPLNNEHSKVIGLASIVIGGCFEVHDFRIVNADKGRFIGMPSKKAKNGEGFMDLAHPLNVDTREYLTKMILEAYDEKVNAKD